jgi:hypothetical protein
VIYFPESPIRPALCMPLDIRPSDHSRSKPGLSMALVVKPLAPRPIRPSIGLAVETCSIDAISMTVKYTGVIHQSFKCASFHKRPDLSSLIASSGTIRHLLIAGVPLNRFQCHNSTSILPNITSYCALSLDTAASESGQRIRDTPASKSQSQRPNASRNEVQ